MVLAAVVLLAAQPAEAGAAGTRASLRIVKTAPLTVRGSGFGAGERVKLLVNAGRPLARTVKAGSRGAFAVRFDVEVDRCTAVVVQAFGNRGSRASVDLTAPDCTPVD